MNDMNFDASGNGFRTFVVSDETTDETYLESNKFEFLASNYPLNCRAVGRTSPVSKSAS